VIDRPMPLAGQGSPIRREPYEDGQILMPMNTTQRLTQVLLLAEQLSSLTDEK